jgi:hypothetical protein
VARPEGITAGREARILMNAQRKPRMKKDYPKDSLFECGEEVIFVLA